jgi:periplasmic divalent cation tolerance protein
MSDTLPQYGLVLVTAPSPELAEAIATALLNAHLAACVNILPIKSLYTWQGKIVKETEWQLLIKTDLNLFSSLGEVIRSLHSYEIPEIIALPLVDGSADYLNWIGSSLG